MTAVMEKVDKRPAKADGPLYEVLHSIYDSDNSLSLEAETVIQTKCENWVKRMGSMLSDPANRIPPNYEASEVLVITGCVEDAGEAVEATPDKEAVPTGKAPRQGFQRRTGKKKAEGDGE